MQRWSWWGAATAAQLVAVPMAVAVPTAVPYMGRLSHSTGAPYTGQVTVVAALYATATPTPGIDTPLWGPHGYGLIDVQDGLLAFVVGGSGSPPLDATALGSSAGVWLLVTLNGVAMTPAQPVYSVPFALRAQEADAVGGLSAAQLATLDDLDALQDALTGGPVQVGNDAADCTVAKAGTLRWTGSALEVCTGAAWQGVGTGGGDPSSCSGPDGQSDTAAAHSCHALLQAGCSTGDGMYWLDPDGSGGALPQRFYCDMTSDGGGWTKLMSATVPFVFGTANWQTYDEPNPLSINYSAVGRRVSFADGLGCYELRMQMGNGSGWTQAPSYTTGWRQCHDPFTSTTDGNDYTHIFGATPLTCGGFNGLHHKYQAYGFASDPDLNDDTNCWYMMIVPKVLYSGGYLHGYLGACGCTLDWQSLWVR